MFNSKSKLQEELIQKQQELIEELKQQVKLHEERITLLKEYVAVVDKISDHQQQTINNLISRVCNSSKCAFCGA
jgi:hypothetical protein